MDKEIAAVEQNKTWDLVSQPQDIKPISCKWVYKVKTRPDGSIERYKERLVARGFSQQCGLDFDKTFSPFKDLNDACCTRIGSNQLMEWQMDVESAFLNE